VTKTDASSRIDTSGVAIGTASSGVIAFVAAGSDLRLADTDLRCRPILHRGDGWCWLSDHESKQRFVAGGAVVETSYFGGGLRIVSHAEQVGERSVVVIDAHNDGDTPFGFGWVLSGPASAVGLTGPAGRTVSLDSACMIAADPPAILLLGQGPVDLNDMERPVSEPVASKRPKQCWAALAGPLTHGLSSRVVLDRIDQPDPAVSGAETVRSGWDAYLAVNAAAIVSDNLTVASLYRAALTRVALSSSVDQVDAALIAAADHSLSNDWPSEAGISRRVLKNPATARRVLFVAKCWAQGSDRQSAEWSDSAGACLGIGAAALDTLERHCEKVDAAAASWLAWLASELDQPPDTVRAISTAGNGEPPRSADATDLASLCLSGWDDRLVERLDRAMHRYGRFPQGFLADTARPLGPVDHDATSAAVVVMIEAMLCTQWAGGLIEILSTLPEGWAKQSVEVSGLELSMGRLSFALRWHDDRAALLWQLDRSQGEADSLKVRCGLDLAFEGRGDTGEALLS
jgi:hypothetical protein